jgi:hypothetical protein
MSKPKGRLSKETESFSRTHAIAGTAAKRLRKMLTLVRPKNKYPGNKPNISSTEPK